MTPFLLLALRPAPLAPRLLIAPLAPAKKDGPAPSTTLANQLAQQMDDDGRTTPIVWGITDPIFRPLALEGKLGSEVPNLPTRAQALAVARKLGADYVFLYRTDEKGGKLNASGELFQDGRTVWRDQKSMATRMGNFQDELNTAASVARTWILLMTTKGGPLKDLASRKVAETPDATPGQGPVVVAPPPTPPPVVATDLGVLDARLGALMKDGKPEAARAFARDAVDADPLSSGPRTALVRLLAAQGDATGAAEEARRAADLMPESPALRFDAVHRLLAIGKLREARDQSNELRARAPEDPAARRLAAEVALASDDAETAVREMESLLKAGEDPQAHLLRGLGRARLGGAEGAAADLKAWADATPAGPARADGLLYADRVLGAMAAKAADAMFALIGRAGAQPKSGAVRDGLDEAQRHAQARVAAFVALPTDGAPAGHAAYGLAHRTLALVAADLRDFLAKGDEDGLTSARLDLGEARRALKTAAGT